MWFWTLEKDRAYCSEPRRSRDNSSNNSLFPWRYESPPPSVQASKTHFGELVCEQCGFYKKIRRLYFLLSLFFSLSSWSGGLIKLGSRTEASSSFLYKNIEERCGQPLTLKLGQRILPFFFILRSLTSSKNGRK